VKDSARVFGKKSRARNDMTAAPQKTEPTWILLARAARALNMKSAELEFKIRIAIRMAWAEMR